MGINIVMNSVRFLMIPDIFGITHIIANTVSKHQISVLQLFPIYKKGQKTLQSPVNNILAFFIGVGLITSAAVWDWGWHYISKLMNMSVVDYRVIANQW